jgi:hypothetical protein
MKTIKEESLARLSSPGPGLIYLSLDHEPVSFDGDEKMSLLPRFRFGHIFGLSDSVKLILVLYFLKIRFY